MPSMRYIIVCEGESEWAYLQRLQSFLDQQPLDAGFEPPLRFIAPRQAVAKNGKFGSLKRQFNQIYRANKRSTIRIWADFDLYHRNDNGCADQYARKPEKIPGLKGTDYLRAMWLENGVDTQFGGRQRDKGSVRTYEQDWQFSLEHRGGWRIGGREFLFGDSRGHRKRGRSVHMNRIGNSANRIVVAGA